MELSSLFRTLSMMSLTNVVSLKLIVTMCKWPIRSQLLFESLSVFSGKRLCVTLQEYQWILTNATVSKDFHFGFIMVVYENILVYYFEVFRRN